MEIHLAGSRPTRRAPKEYFTGTVWQDPIVAAPAPARIVCNRVSFEPGARTNWHSHPLGQTLYVVAAASAQPQNGLKIVRNGAQPATRGAIENFTGSVRVDTQFLADAPARVSGGLVTFDPGAHSAWHTHPLGQTLIVTQGVGLVQRWGGPVQEIRPGDVVWIPPGEKHWHGGSPTTGMTHIALQESLDGNHADWMEPVSEADYSAKVG